MSNENKKAWIRLILPVGFILVLLFVPRPEVLNNIGGFIVLLVIFLICQSHLNRILNEKFPAYEDLNDD